MILTINIPSKIHSQVKMMQISNSCTVFNPRIMVTFKKICFSIRSDFLKENFHMVIQKTFCFLIQSICKRFWMCHTQGVYITEKKKKNDDWSKNRHILCQLRLTYKNSAYLKRSFHVALGTWASVITPFTVSWKPTHISLKFTFLGFKDMVERSQVLCTCTYNV